jgi:membrane-associated phospholipid phosphatase
MSTSKRVSPRSQAEDQQEKGVSRRKFLGGVGGVTAAAMAAGSLGIEALFPGGSSAAAEIGPQSGKQRRDTAWQVRKAAADYNRSLPVPAHPDNGDEARYPNKIGSYSKGLPHNRWGEVDLGAYATLIHALESGDPDDFEKIQLGGENLLTNPQSGLAFDLEGTDSHQLVEPPPPALGSAEEAGEAVELYWMALLRDIDFKDYANSPLAAAAVDDLNSMSAFAGPRLGGKVAPQTLFRDTAPGCRIGPYLSQFMIKTAPFGSQFVEPTFRTFVPGGDHLTHYGNWLAVQNGHLGVEPPTPFAELRRYPKNGRDMAAFVHVDVLFQAYFNAALLLLTPTSEHDGPSFGGIGAHLNPTNPYLKSKTQAGFGTFGGPHIVALMAEVSSRALKAQWYQKWYVHRRLRPEAFGGVVHNQIVKNRYPGVLHNDLLKSPALARVASQHGSYLLPLPFAEGSPTHPAYGSGHATVAGACITVLKAMFDEKQLVPFPVQVSSDGISVEPYTGADLTIGGELNKLASNVATARNISGVHWRTDGYGAMRLGQAVAVSVLRDQRADYNERFDGFSFTGLDGETITI